jgi:hypothetical protein
MLRLELTKVSLNSGLYIPPRINSLKKMDERKLSSKGNNAICLGLRVVQFVQFQQRSDRLAAMPAEAQLFAPRPGQKPRTAFLATLGEIITAAAA